MATLWESVILLVGFSIIALSSGQIGKFFTRIKFPLITGFLFTGIIAGPFVLGLIPGAAIERLRFVDEISLAFIAFAAGSEIYLKELGSRFRSIIWVTFGNVLVIPILGGLVIFLLSDSIPFMRAMPTPSRFAVSILAGAILVARSPSSAIAIINELRAKGPFTQTILGVTMITDFVVIILFAISSSIADTLFTNLGVDPTFVILLLVELLLSLAAGYLLGKILLFILTLSTRRLVKTGTILLVGYGVFVSSAVIRNASHQLLSFEILLEPLLICMIGSFFVTNYTNYRTEFLKILEESGPPIYIAFFTLTGASLNLNLLAAAWPIALVVFATRVTSIYIASLSGGVLAGDPLRHNQLSWMAYITQAGVGLGLAKEVMVEFPAWGTAFATMIISAIVISQIVGPPLFKWAVQLVGEAHTRARTPEFDGVRDALIFGLERQALVLGRHLQAHGWQIKIAFPERSKHENFEATDIVFHPLPDLTLESLKGLELEHADAIICLLEADEDNYRICELIYEHFGIDTVVVRLKDRTLTPRFRELGALIVDPSTATVHLLEQFVRSPSAASLILGLAGNQDIAEFEVRDPTLHGITLRNLRLPLDTLVLSVRRRGQVLISHGYTQLEVGDRVTVVGSPKSLEEVMLRFDV